jgi:hypothetical protein
MKNILLTYFPSVYTLEAFFNEINLKLTDKSEQERLKKCVKNLASVIVAFDFKLTGPLKSYIDKRFTYEQLLYLCFIKINESAPSAKFFENHMFKTNVNNSNIRNVKANLNLPASELEKRMASTENLAICYFLSRQNGENVGDGVYWRELFDLVGSSITKYIIIYSYLFRKVNNSKNVYVQISGPKFNVTFRTLIQDKLVSDEKMIKEKIKQSVVRGSTSKSRHLKVEPVETKPPSVNKLESKPVKLNTVFEAKDESIKQQVQNLKTVEFQLEKLGHQKLNKTSILYDRYLGSRISGRFIYNNRSLEPNETTGNQILSKFIFDKADFSLYANSAHVDDMKLSLNQILIKFMKQHRSCPFKVFLNCYCEQSKEKVQAKSESIQHKAAIKRNRNGEKVDNKKSDPTKNRY